VETFTSSGTAGDFLALGQPVGTVGDFGEFEEITSGGSGQIGGAAQFLVMEKLPSGVVENLGSLGASGGFNC